MSADMQREREQFEAWFSDNGTWPKSLERSGDGYLLMAAQSAWRVWQAARRSQGQEWISVQERLPERGQGVIAYRPTAHLTNDDPITITFFIGGEANESWQGVKHGFDCVCHPSHWMPLPAAPSGEGRNRP